MISTYNLGRFDRRLPTLCLAVGVLIAALPMGLTRAQGTKRPSPKQSSTVAYQRTLQPGEPQGKSLPPANWIWSPSQAQGRVPAGDMYFRKTIQLPKVPVARVQIVADDAYEVYINGRRIGTGAGATSMSAHECGPLIIAGENLIAIRVSNRSGATGGLFARFYVQLADGQWRGMGTSDTWKCSDRLQAGWQQNRFNDANWQQAVVIGDQSDLRTNESNTDAGTSDSQLANTVNSAVPKAMTNSATPKDSKAQQLASRFKTRQGFVVEQVVDEIDCGSVVAMAFNEFGHIIAAQEGGPLLLIYETGKEKKTQRIRTYCDLVKNIQGILPLNGDVYVTGEGAEGNGLYRLVDGDRDGQLEAAEKVFGVKGQVGEHGAHQIALGPDGMLYVVIGNHVQVDTKISSTSPYRFTYEGDLVQPRREDPSGHAAGMKAPGGTVVRVDLRSKDIDIVAGGLRNAYDLAFHPTNGLYLQDSDMEADIGTTWHRSTNIFKIAEGGEYGWRSGWAAWPEYYIDRLPALADTGRGSPTGAVFYDHHQYPAEYHQHLFVGDWAQGRILSINVEPNKDGALEPALEFVSGTPMNVTDLDVGPDGSLYFCTGGRGTGGGVFRVKWTGEPMLQDSQLGKGIARAIRQPQLASAWGRQSIAMQKRELGDDWDDLIAGVAFSPDNPARYRMRALDLMQLVGPVPSVNLLVDLSRTPNESLRAKVATQLALHSDEERAVTRLAEMVNDKSELVQRAACEALIRTDASCAVDKLVPLLKSESRELEFLARRLLLRSPLDEWNDLLLDADDPNVVINGALASVIKDPGPNNTNRVIERLQGMLDDYLSDETFVNLLRVYQVALHLGPSTDEQKAAVRELVDREFPAGQPIINREIIRLAAYVQSQDVIDRVIDYIATDNPISERVHVAMYACTYHKDWTPDQRTKLLRFYEDAQRSEGGASYALYIMQISRELGENMSQEEAIAFLKQGEEYPNATLAGLMKLPEQLDTELYEEIIKLDVRIDKQGFEADVYKRLKTGITAVLARSGDERSMRYLRQAWRRSPDRRPSITLALAQQPDGENWDYIVRSLSLIEPYATEEILTQLKSVPIATDDPAALRQTILHGLKLREEGKHASTALDLLTYWVGEDMGADATDEDSKLKAWQQWYTLRYPDKPDPVLPSRDDSKWTVDDLEQYLQSDQGAAGNIEAGAAVFAKAQCANCHRFNEKGTNLGPDLTTVASRFTRRETLESILYPSHVISDQYATSKVLTRDGTIVSGMKVEDDEGNISLTNANGETTRLAADEVEEVLLSKTSLMPSGLMDHLSQPEIRDLMAYMKLLPAAKSESSQIAEQNTDTIRK